MTFKTKGTKEWAVKNINICDGCSNNCVYCYAKATRGRFDDNIKAHWGEMKLKPKYSAKKRYGKYEGAVMFPSSHDITPANINECIITLRALLTAGNHVIIVSKPRYLVIGRLLKEFMMYKKQLIFRFTINSCSSYVQYVYEPNAPLWGERVAALQLAYELGFTTSISMEPFLEEIQNIPALIVDLQNYVTESLWIGPMNKRYCPPDLWDEKKWGKAALIELDRLLHENPLIDWTMIQYKDAFRYALEEKSSVTKPTRRINSGKICYELI